MFFAVGIGKIMRYYVSFKAYVHFLKPAQTPHDMIHEIDLNGLTL